MEQLDRVSIPSAGITCGSLTWEEGRIVACRADTTPPDGEPDLLLPGFVDIHIHGAGGADTSAPGELPRIGETLARWGVTGWLPTFHPRPHEDLLAHLDRAAEVVGSDPGRGARVAGFHLEGPFVNPDCSGALARQHLRPADPELLAGIIAAGRGLVRIITIAPELPGALDLIALAVEKGVVVSLGHTLADDAQVAAALAAGATRVTHLFNAMAPLGHRQPGPVGAALLPGGPGPELIADGIHVAPAVMELVLRLRGGPGDGLCLVSDAMAPAGTDAETGSFDGRRVTVREGAMRDEAGRLTGSALLLSQGVVNLVSKGLLDWPQAALLAAENPARLAGLERTGRIAPGWRADLVLWRQGRPVRVWIGGVEVACG